MPNNIQITITTDAGTVDLTTRELTAAEVDLFKDFCWSAYPQLDTDGNELARTPAREAAAVRDWIRGVFKGTAGNLRRFKQEQAQPAPEPEIDLEA